MGLLNCLRFSSSFKGRFSVCYYHKIKTMLFNKSCGYYNILTKECFNEPFCCFETYGGNNFSMQQRITS